MLSHDAGLTLTFVLLAVVLIVGLLFLFFALRQHASKSHAVELQQEEPEPLLLQLTKVAKTAAQGQVESDQAPEIVFHDVTEQGEDKWRSYINSPTEGLLFLSSYDKDALAVLAKIYNHVNWKVANYIPLDNRVPVWKQMLEEFSNKTQDKDHQ